MENKKCANCTSTNVVIDGHTMEGAPIFYCLDCGFSFKPKM